MIGDKDSPIRCSKLKAIGQCSMRLVMLELLDDDSEGGEAAQSGSLTHEGVAAFHKETTFQLKEKAAWDAIASMREKFPLADMNEVRLFITPYMADPRNLHAQFEQINGKPAIEVPVEFWLEPHELDKTGQRIFVQGTADQIRLLNGVPRVYDLKTGKPDGIEMVAEALFQIAAYTVGARQLGGLFAITEPGSIIRNRGYRTRENKGVSPDGVFWHVSMTDKAIDYLMETVRFDVALIRNGYAMFRPGKNCRWCEYESYANCTNVYENLRVK